MPNTKITQRELLIRIDERQQQMSKDIQDLKKSMSEKVPMDDDYTEMKGKVDKLWDWRNKVIGYAAGAGAIASIVFEVIKTVL